MGGRTAAAAFDSSSKRPVAVAQRPLRVHLGKLFHGLLLCALRCAALSLLSFEQLLQLGDARPQRGCVALRIALLNCACPLVKACSVERATEGRAAVADAKDLFAVVAHASKETDLVVVYEVA